MDRFHRQRGYKAGKLLLVVLIAAAGYFGVTFWPAAKAHYSIKNDAKRLANQLLVKDGSDPERHVERFLEVVNDREDLVLTRGEVIVENEDDLVEVKVHVELPYEYPFLDEQRLWKTTIEVFAERVRGF